MGAESVTLREHLEALRAADDRRYAEVALEREKALRIKDTADRDALALARQGQTYRDEQSNKLREQINSERGLYATKDDLANAVREMTAVIKPLAEYVSAAAGRSGGEADTRTESRLNINAIIAALAVAVALVSVILYATKK